MFLFESQILLSKRAGTVGVNAINEAVKVNSDGYLPCREVKQREAILFLFWEVLCLGNLLWVNQSECVYMWYIISPGLLRLSAVLHFKNDRLSISVRVLATEKLRPTEELITGIRTVQYLEHSQILPQIYQKSFLPLLHWPIHSGQSRIGTWEPAPIILGKRKKNNHRRKNSWQGKQTPHPHPLTTT